MVNKPLIRPYFWGGYVGGGWLTSHDKVPFNFLMDIFILQTFQCRLTSRGKRFKVQLSVFGALDGRYGFQFFLKTNRPILTIRKMGKLGDKKQPCEFPGKNPSLPNTS